MCHLSRVTCHVSHVACHMIFFNAYIYILTRWWSKSVQGLTESSFIWTYCSKRSNKRWTFTESDPRPIQSTGCNIWLYVVPSWKQRIPVDWRPLIKERSGNTGQLEEGFITFYYYNYGWMGGWGFWFLVNRPTVKCAVHSGGFSWWRVWCCGCRR